MKLNVLLALLGASSANDDILEGLTDNSSPQYNNLNEEVSVVDSLQSGLTPSEEARKQAFKEQEDQQKAIDEAVDVAPQESQKQIVAPHKSKKMVSHVQSKNFPPLMKALEMPKLNASSVVTQVDFNLTDQRLPNGLMNWTDDQELAVLQYLKQKKWIDNSNYRFGKKADIMNMDKTRQKDPKEGNVGDVKKRKESSKKLNIHLVPHTHDDVGWLKTYEQYFTGENGKSDPAAVTNIISEVVLELLRDPEMRFTYVEMKYFNMWYTRQTKKMQEDAKMLIKEGRLEITMGGWVGPEESTANYEDLISNFVKGHGWLKNEFGVAPTVGWNVDPFGHTQANAAIFHDLGFEALFFSRAGQDEIKQRYDPDNHASLFLWRPMSKHFGNQKEILGGILTERETYYSPTGLGNDMRAPEEPQFQDDPTLSGFNVWDQLNKLFNQAHEQINAQSNDENIMFLLGGDFTYQNAFNNFQNVRKIVENCNKYGKELNITCTCSTPKTYVDSLKKENVQWPIKYDDFMNYHQDEKDKNNRTHYNFWSGFYSSRPGIKAHVKTASAQYYAQSKIVARKMLDQDAKAAEIKEYLKSNDILLDQLSILQHHDAVTGTAKQFVTYDYQFRLQKAQDISDVTYKKEIVGALQAYAGISVKDGSKGIKRCVGQQNATVVDCPVSNNADKDFIVAVHNPRSKEHEGLIRILLPSKNYRAQVFSNENATFYDVYSDILEQKHFSNDGGIVSDFEMVIQTPEIKPDQVTLVKIIFSPNYVQDKQESKESKQLLEIQGFSNEGHVLFKYTNEEQKVNQTFGVNIKKYIAHQMGEVKPSRMFLDKWNYTADEKADVEQSEGAYIFKPEWRSPKPQLYGKLSEDVMYEKGSNIEQWTITFDDPKTKEQALIKVRFSPFIQELIEFNVELNGIPIADSQGKDVTVNWKMFNGFDAGETFWTDSNSLEMEQRNIRKLIREDETIAGNMYPITSAIAMRDFKNGSNTQITVMNDRAQGGAADLSDRSTIELIQHRRLTRDDDKGVIEPLDETNSFDDYAIQVNARYFVQIFNHDKGKSLQRSQQIKLQSSLQYFFIFDFKEKDDFKKLTQTHQSLSELQKNKFLDQGFYRLMPVAKDQVIMTFENLADRFDKSSEVSFINVEKLAQDLYQEINQKTADSLLIEEVTIQGTQLEKDRLKNTFKWQGVDDGTQLEFSKRPEDKNGFKGVAIEPQRIRSFKLTYNQKKPEFIQSHIVKLNQIRDY